MKANIKHFSLFSLLFFSPGISANALYVNWSVVDGQVHIEGINPTDPDNPIIWDNDYMGDVCDAYLPFAMASLGKARVVGLICTVEAHASNGKIDSNWGEFTDFHQTLLNAGWKNCPAPVEGSPHTLTSLTDAVESEGARLIIREAKKCTPQKPLFINVGGQLSTVAAAYLLDPTIAENIIVFHADPYGFNGVDQNARAVVQAHIRYVGMTDKHWWPSPKATGDPSIITQAMIDSLKDDAVGQAIRKWKASWAGQDYADLGDGGGVCWFFGQHTWNNMKNDDNITQLIDFDPYQQGKVWAATVTRQDIASGARDSESRSTAEGKDTLRRRCAN